MGKIRVAIAGVGNCASSLVQGIEYYRWVTKDSGYVPGILFNEMEGYLINDIEFVAAFDIHANKIGKDLSEAIFTKPNCATKFCEVPSIGVIVQKGPVLDGIGEKLKNIIPIENSQKEIIVSDTLKEHEAEILINFLPTGSIEATEYYAEESIRANCAFINAIPEPIASNLKWRQKYEKAGLPLVGDDLKSQIGATILHRTIIDLLCKRGAYLKYTSQLNVGGNTDFINLSENNRVESKIESKKISLINLVSYPFDLLVSQPQYIESQGDNKVCYISLKGENFGNRPFSIDLKLSVEDSPNAAGVMIDIIRAIKIALDNKKSGILSDICSYYFKYNDNTNSDSYIYWQIEKNYSVDNYGKS